MNVAYSLHYPYPHKKQKKQGELTPTKSSRETHSVGLNFVLVRGVMEESTPSIVTGGGGCMKNRQ